MKKIFFLIVICSLMSCTSDNEPKTSNYVYNISTDIIVTTNNNEDLLNTDTPNYFDNDAIRIEHLKNNGNYIEFYQPNLDYKYDFMIYNDSGFNVFRLFNQIGRDYIINNKITSVIKWNATKRDTIVTELTETPNNLTKTKVWVNGELKYDMHNGLTPEVITIVK